MSDINPSRSLVSLASTASEEPAVTPMASTANLIAKNPAPPEPPRSTPAGATAGSQPRGPAAVPSNPPAKDYQAAFAALSSSYGLPGGGPVAATTPHKPRIPGKNKTVKKVKNNKGKAVESSAGTAPSGNA